MSHSLFQFVSVGGTAADVYDAGLAQEKRLDHLLQMCEQNGPPPLAHHRHLPIYINEKHRTLHCLTPKAGCTNFKRMLIWASGLYQDDRKLDKEYVHVPYTMEHYGYYRLNRVPNMTDINKSYYKVMIIRNPIRRLVSCYRDKQKDLSNIILQLVKGLPDTLLMQHKAIHERAKNGQYLSFAEFVQFIIDTYHVEGLGPFAEHWLPITQICQVCRVHYDFIISMEHVDEDIRLLQKLGHLNSSIQYPSGRDPGEKQSFYSDEWETYATGLFNQLSSIQMKKVLEIYKDDFDYLGYGASQV